MLLALFCACTARFLSDLFGNHIVGFPMRRLNLCGVSFSEEYDHKPEDCIAYEGLVITQSVRNKTIIRNGYVVLALKHRNERRERSDVVVEHRIPGPEFEPHIRHPVGY